MSDNERVNEFVEEIRRAAGDRFAAAYRFGSDIARGKGKGQARVLVAVASIDRALLDEVGPVISQAQQDGIRVRLDTADNLLRGADAFPAFSLELIRHRSLLAGNDVLADLKVEPAHLRLRVEHGLRGIQRDLVSGYIEGKLHGGSLLEVRRSTRRLLFLVEGALMAAGTDLGEAPTPATLIAKIREPLRDDPDAPWETFTQFLAGELSLSTEGMRTLYGSLLAILERVIDHVDRMPD
ncbi:MAG: hypothetical protein AAF721_12900 [Myxococcota bacterium]